jgi:adenylylsulfate kinase-like enzyme
MLRILVLGLPGSGKTTIAREIVQRFKLPHFNADQIRQNVNKDLDFSLEARIEQACRMGYLSECSAANGTPCVTDFVCPTLYTRLSFCHTKYCDKPTPMLMVFMDTLKASRFNDTNHLFQPPTEREAQSLSCVSFFQVTDFGESKRKAMHAVFSTLNALRTYREQT